MKRLVLIITLVVLCLVGAYAAYALLNDKKATISTEQKPSVSEGKSDETICADIAASGRYVDYSDEILSEKCSGYNKTILFFYAPWCPECRGFDQAIKASTVPGGTQILKVDYDSSTDLKKKYGVTIQTTFVRVDENGEKVKLWTGYGAEKSLDLILENT